MDNNEQQPAALYSKGAEAALLGSLLIDPGQFLELDLELDDFYIQRNRWVFEAMQAIAARGGKPDVVTLSEEIERRGNLDEIGGVGYLLELSIQTPSSLGSGQYARIVREYAQRRRMVQIANGMAKAAYNLDANLEAAAGDAVDALTRGIRPKAGAVHISHYVDDLEGAILERSANPGAVWGIPTGILDYDKATGGLQPGEVVYIAGEPGVGKSILSMQMGFNMGRAGFPGAIYSLEMGGRQVVQRALSASARIETRKIKAGLVEEQEWPLLNQAIAALRGLPVYLSDEANLTTTALRADLARLKVRHGIRWFVLDYLYLMADGDGRMDDTERTALLARRIKSVCLELDLAGVTVNSVTKDGMDTGKASKQAVRGSGEVVHAADIIGNLLPHQPGEFEKQEKSLRTFAFTKGRELEALGHFHLVKMDRWPAFGDYTPEPNAQRVAGNGRAK
jgi:replicative DNA helicase